MAQDWNYLIVTASNDAQARAYEAQLKTRNGNAMVVADPRGVRIGSGGSTLYCLAHVVNAEIARRSITTVTQHTAEEILRDLRILIIHAGGDSKRLPAYGPCGKIFVPLPGGSALFDRLAASFMSLPEGAEGRGQVVVASGDALILLDPTGLDFSRPGVNALTNKAEPEAARKHGVFCAGAEGALRVYLQKPSPDEQKRTGALDSNGKALLDLGVMSWDAETSARWLRIFGFVPDKSGKFNWSGQMEQDIFTHGLDLYREICCAMGTEATLEHYKQAVRSSGSTWDEKALCAIFEPLHAVPMHVSKLDRCSFLHFGTTRQLLESGKALIEYDGGAAPENGILQVNVQGPGPITGRDAWVEGCTVSAALALCGDNVIVGVDVDQPTALPLRACLDVLPGSSRKGDPVFFVRCYGIGDAFKDAQFCGRPLLNWLAAVGASPEEFRGSNLWDARVFPAVKSHAEYRNWLWMFEPEGASPEQKAAWMAADRYSAEDVALLYRQEDFYLRRARTDS